MRGPQARNAAERQAMSTLTQGSGAGKQKLKNKGGITIAGSESQRVFWV